MALDYHLERKLRFNASSEYKSLYSWSIGEFDASGKQIGGAQIPWGWSLPFTANEIVLRDQLEIETLYRTKQDKEVKARRLISATLRPGDQRSDKDWYRRTVFRMLGTDRVIENFTLDIRPLGSDDEEEECRAWGIVSYDHDEFHPQTTDDIVGFDLAVKPSMFQLYFDRISAGTAVEVVLVVTGVKGFYSDWSPDIFTQEVKVLCAGDEQQVEMPDGDHHDLPRLREISTALLQINDRRALGTRQRLDDADSYEDEPSSELLVEPAVTEGVPSPIADPTGSVTLLDELRTLARWIIGLLIVLIIVVL